MGTDVQTGNGPIQRRGVLAAQRMATAHAPDMAHKGLL